MYSSPVPIEWVKGNSRTWYFLAYFSFLLVLYWVTLTVIPGVLFGPAWAQGGFLRFLLVLGVALAIVVPWAIVWALLVPMPPVGIGISPAGAILDWGVRQQQFKWQEVSTHSGRLYVNRSRWLPSFPIPLSGYQFERLTHFLRRAACSG
ncbi:MAG: hypothetical protein L3K14_04340 [Thermoplasmata archaeon]|nr:hypothetical protein [Thermoplasmata archaeon]